MADAASFIDEQRRAELAALAQGGIRAAEEYARAQAAIGANQAGAIDSALAESRTRGAGAPAEQAISAIIGRGSASGLTALGARAAADATRMSARSSVEDAYMNKLLGALPAIEAELASSGGGGGGGRGRGGGDDDELSWRTLLSEAYGPTEGLRKAGLAWDAESMVEGTGAPRAVGVQAVADEFGVPQFAIEDMFPGTRFMRLGREQIDVERGRGGTVRDYRQILRTAAKDKKQWPGSQAQMRRYLTQQARQVLPRGKKRKRRR